MKLFFTVTLLKKLTEQYLQIVKATTYDETIKALETFIFIFFCYIEKDFSGYYKNINKFDFENIKVSFYDKELEAYNSLVGFFDGDSGEALNFLCYIITKSAHFKKFERYDYEFTNTLFQTSGEFDMYIGDLEYVTVKHFIEKAKDIRQTKEKIDMKHLKYKKENQRYINIVMMKEED